MARIRSIKPDFWRDGKIASLSKEAALFFIAMWNFADDDGVITSDTKELSLLVPIFRSQSIQHILSSLHKADLIRLSRGACRGLIGGLDGSSGGAEVYLITGWNHQKIDKKRAGKYNINDIEWLTWSDYPKGIEDSTTVRRKDRIGKDMIGEDRNTCVTKPKIDTSPEAALSGKIWVTYVTEFFIRYGVKPVRNAKVNGQIRQLAKRLGNDAIEVVKFYLTHNDAWYLKNQHPIGGLLQNAEGLHTQWLRKKPVTSLDVRNAEKTLNTQSLLDQIDKGEI